MNAMAAILVMALAVAAVVAAQEPGGQEPGGQEPGGRPARDTQAEDAVKKLEQEWVEAYRQRDAAFLERVLADDYAFITPGGTVLDKSRQIDDLKSGANASEFQFSELKVRVYGDTAVVTGKIAVKGRLRDQDITGEYRFTRVYVERGERWQCVAAQATRIAQP